MKLSVIIVSYKVRDYLLQCLSSLERAIASVDAEVIVVDNHSQDDSAEAVAHSFPEVHFIDSNVNLGFARANNKAIRLSQGEYVLLLNPDTVVGEEVLTKALNFMDNHPDAGGAGLRMLRSDGSDARESRRGRPTPMSAFYKMIGLCERYPRNRRFGHYYMGWLPWDKPSQIDVISGAFCLLRRRALDEVGLLDEAFFMYGEDIDLSYRLKQGGWNNWYLPLKILHYKGESTEKSSFRYVHVFYEAMLIYFRKHYRHLSLLFFLPVQLAIYLKAFLALCGMQWSKMVKMMGFVKRTVSDDPLFIYHGDSEGFISCRQLMERKGLHLEQSVSPGEVQLQKTGALSSKVKFSEDSSETTFDRKIYEVFDMRLWQCHEVFDVFSIQPRSNREMAFYWPNEKMVVTSREIVR